jgi:alkanesulfonate monooxygenase SsuD/methylene tetrahydromethanopterin reductase-like flavin-dependent oxidoreductase (luciferase family)
LAPDADQAEAVVELARAADRLGLDLFGVQEHPYRPHFLDRWTLLSVLAGQTGRIRLVPDVVHLPCGHRWYWPGRRAASLDILTGGGVEQALGSGALAKTVGSMGGLPREAGEASTALEEAIAAIRALWTPGPAVTFEG